MSGTDKLYEPGPVGNIILEDIVKKLPEPELEILENDSLGIAKDGTTRRKVKTQETYVLLSNGKHYSLGFSSLASETGEAIKNDVEAKLDELAAVAGESDFKAKALQKLAFLISDRAANEKKSNKIIKEWSSLILQTPQPHQVKEYFCMAHVLLAFHAYSLKQLKAFGSELGLDFSSYKNPLEKFLKYALDIFGPVGDYRGEWPKIKKKDYNSTVGAKGESYISTGASKES
ncbi:hypothetical protein PoB_006433800 [Plakobranchus ocellatus]|uniref:Uncharacterized protein n=1 Tax=Plakobranchus ocellatus TaxID=259542 RepID=A0AAV4D139_9GAST|nr:hypothetical protein PoB_006433800 [Plakobranchus ocellatus]